MDFMLLIYGSEAAWSSLDQTTIDRIGDTHRSIQRRLRTSGELVDSKELSLEDAAVVRRHDDRVAAAAGPLMHEERLLGGYYVVDCSDVDRATEIATWFEEAAFAPIEVRALSDATSWDTRAPRG